MLEKLEACSKPPLWLHAGTARRRFLSNFKLGLKIHSPFFGPFNQLLVFKDPVEVPLNPVSKFRVVPTQDVKPLVYGRNFKSFSHPVCQERGLLTT